MTVDEFIVEFQDIIQAKDKITSETVLIDLEEWDSMAIMSCIAWFDVNLNVTLAFNDFLPIDTVQDVINLSQGKISA